MTHLGYMLLRTEYIDRTRRRTQSLEKEILCLAESGSDDLIAADSQVGVLVRGISESKILLEKMLFNLESSGEVLWYWSQMIDDIELLWARVRKALNQVQEMLEEKAESSRMIL